MVHNFRTNFIIYHNFLIKNHVKPTAIDRCFLYGSSHHLMSIYESIMFTGAVQMCKINEDDQLYLQSLRELDAKC